MWSGTFGLFFTSRRTRTVPCLFGALGHTQMFLRRSRSTFRLLDLCTSDVVQSVLVIGRPETKPIVVIYLLRWDVVSYVFRQRDRQKLIMSLPQPLQVTMAPRGDRVASPRRRCHCTTPNRGPISVVSRSRYDVNPARRRRTLLEGPDMFKPPSGGTVPIGRRTTHMVSINPLDRGQGGSRLYMGRFAPSSRIWNPSVPYARPTEGGDNRSCKGDLTSDWLRGSRASPRAGPREPSFGKRCGLELASLRHSPCGCCRARPHDHTGHYRLIANSSYVRCSA